jgi:hypothetical protein
MTAQLAPSRCPRCAQQYEASTMDELLDKIHSHSESCKGDKRR